MGEKTEKATPKKLQDAKKKGQVAKSQDLPAAFTFMASVAIVLGLSKMMYGQLSDFFILVFGSVTNANLDELIRRLFYEANEVIFMASIPVLGLVAALGVIVNFLSVGPMFSMEALKFDLKKLNPIDNLKGKFKLKTLVELLKSVIKISVASYIIYLVMYKSIPILIKTVSLPISSALLVFHAFLLEVMIKVGLFFIVVAVIDFIYQKQSFAKEMMMEKFEVKQEYKNSEGDPHIKSKRRQIAQEMAYQDGPSGGIKRAKAVVTNPTHIAVAIAYERGVDAAPYIVGMGKDALAGQMIKLAEKYGIPVLRNIPLAHELWDEGEVMEYVPETTYRALAEILRWIAALEQGDVVEPPAERL